MRKDMKTLIHGIWRKVNFELDARKMNAWVEGVVKNPSIRNKKYQSVFVGYDLDNKLRLTGAAGRLAGMRVLVSHGALRGELDLPDGTVKIIDRSADAPFASVPFPQVFDLCSELREELGAMLAPDCRAVPFLGGIRSIILSDEPQIIADYYLPEAELYGEEGSFTLFRAEHVSPNLPMPGLAPESGTDHCRELSRTEYPAEADYLVRMEKVLEKLRSEQLQKIVISRKRSITADDAFRREDYIDFMLKNFFQEYFFQFRQGENAYWASISPEIIMKQRGRRAVTKPLAGTRKKYEDEALNEQMRQELNSTTKDITEHEYALQFMRQQLEDADIGKVTIDKERILLETPYTFHIKSEISVALKENVNCFDIISAIYPPATVWGIPVDETEYTLARTEPYEREFFTGVYGWWDFSGSADTALIIRCARIDGREVSVYAGGGIVSDSDPHAEFEETVNKMRPLSSFFVE